jgi:hypothetical protein
MGMASFRSVCPYVSATDPGATGAPEKPQLAGGPETKVPFLS